MDAVEITYCLNFEWPSTKLNAKIVKRLWSSYTGCIKKKATLNIHGEWRDITEALCTNGCEVDDDLIFMNIRCVFKHNRF